MRLLFLYLICIILFSCQKKDKSQVFSDNKAKWIQIEKDLPDKDSLFYQDDPSQCLERNYLLIKK